MKNPLQPGTDTNMGNTCSRTAFSWAQKTFKNRHDLKGEPVLRVEGSFCNIMAFGKERIGMTSDGIGTKVDVAERVGKYDSLGFDLVAMVADDLAANGIEPANISNILDVDVLHQSIVDELMKGLHDAANFAGIAVTGGEIAELGTRIGGYGRKMHFNWCSTAIGFLPSGTEPVTGTSIRPGDSIIALRNPGFRSNGFSMVRKVLSERFGDSWHEKRFSAKLTWGEAVLTPSLIYSPLIFDLLHSGVKINGISHITGGGIPDNLGRILRTNGLGAELEDLFPPDDFVLELQSIGKVKEAKAYHTWNMGNGMLLVVPKEKCKSILAKIGKTSYEAKFAGKIIDRPEIIINSQGAFPQVLSYEKTGK